MGLNKSTGNMYPFITATWNTVKGKCLHDCHFCYMKRFGEQKPIHFDRKELKTDLGYSNFIFVGSSCDMWADDVPGEWQVETLRHCEDFENKYLFQSKNPRGIYRYPYSLPYNSYVCVTIETNRRYPEMGKTTTTEDRAYWLRKIRGYPKHITIEPIMDFDFDEFMYMLWECEPEQVNIGADSGNNHLTEPTAEKIGELIKGLKTFTTVIEKKNLKRIYCGTLF